MDAEAPAPSAISTKPDSWAQVLLLLQQCGRVHDGERYALTAATLKRKGDDALEQIEALRLAERNLLQAARDEISDAVAEAGDRRTRSDPKQARLWGRAMSNAIVVQVREAADEEQPHELPLAALELARDAERQVRETIQAHHQAQADAEAKALAEAQKTLLIQAEAVAQAQALADEQAQALEQAQAQAAAVAKMQAQIHAEAAAAQEQQAEAEAALVERNALRAQGLNSKKLPLRPGTPPCAFFMRKGECKYGRTCKWDHPEATVNSKGYPIRPGEIPCAFYLRTGVCKFSNTCKFDHPENVTPTMAASALNSDLGSQLISQLASLAGANAMGDLENLAAVAMAASASPAPGGLAPSQPPPPPGAPIGVAAPPPPLGPGLPAGMIVMPPMPLGPAPSGSVSSAGSALPAAPALPGALGDASKLLQSVGGMEKAQQDQMLSLLLQQAQQDLGGSLATA